MTTPEPMTYDEAVALTAEIAAALGGRQARALEVLVRYASRGRRPTTARMEAVRDQSTAAMHFARVRHGLTQAREDIDQGMALIGASARVLREQNEEETP